VGWVRPAKEPGEAGAGLDYGEAGAQRRGVGVGGAAGDAAQGGGQRAGHRDRAGYR